MLHAVGVKIDSNHLLMVIVTQNLRKQGAIGRVETGKGAGLIYKAVKLAIRTDVRAHDRACIVDGPSIGKSRARESELAEMTCSKQEPVGEALRVGVPSHDLSIVVDTVRQRACGIRHIDGFERAIDERETVIDEGRVNVKSGDGSLSIDGIAVRLDCAGHIDRSQTVFLRHSLGRAQCEKNQDREASEKQ